MDTLSLGYFLCDVVTDNYIALLVLDFVLIIFLISGFGDEDWGFRTRTADEDWRAPRIGAYRRLGDSGIVHTILRYCGYCTALDRRTDFLAQHVQWDGLAERDYIDIQYYVIIITVLFQSEYSIIILSGIVYTILRWWCTCTALDRPCGFSSFSVSSRMVRLNGIILVFVLLLLWLFQSSIVFSTILRWWCTVLIDVRIVLVQHVLVGRPADWDPVRVCVCCILVYSLGSYVLSCEPSLGD